MMIFLMHGRQVHLCWVGLLYADLFGIRTHILEEMLCEADKKKSGNPTAVTVGVLPSW